MSLIYLRNQRAVLSFVLGERLKYIFAGEK